MVPQPNRWRAQAGEMSLAENVVLENDLLQKEPATSYYNVSGPTNSTGPAGPLEFLSIDGQLVNQGGPVTHAGVAVWLPCTAGVAAQEATTTLGAIASVGATWTLPALVLPGGSVASGAHTVTLSRSGTAGTALATGVTDSAGNVYTLLADTQTTYSGSPPAWRVQLWGALLTKPLPTGATVTVTLGATGMHVAAIGRWYASVSSLAPIANPVLSCPATAPYTFSTYNTTANGPEFVKPHHYPIRGIAAVVTDDDNASPPLRVSKQLWSITTTPYGNAAAQLLGAMSLFSAGSAQGIIGQIEWNSLAQSTTSGTVTMAAGSRNVNGTGTAFLTEYRPGDQITVGGVIGRVAAVTSNTLLTVDAPWPTLLGPTAPVRRAGPVLITAAVYDYLAYQTVLYKEQPANNSVGLKGNLTAVNIAPNLAVANIRRARFVAAGQEAAQLPRKLFFFNGVNIVQVLTGDANVTHNITKPPVDWGITADPNKQPVNAIAHLGRLWAFGNMNAPHMLYGSNPEDHEDFTTTINTDSARGEWHVMIQSGVGERLWGGAEYQGILYLWKYPIGIFYLDDTNTDYQAWQALTRSTATGCAPSAYAVLATDDDVLWCDPTAHFHLLSAVATLGGTADSDLTRLLGLQAWTDANVDLPSLGQMTSVFDTATKTAWFGLRSKQAVAAGSVNNDLVVRFEFGNPGIVRTLSSMSGTLPAPRVTTARCWTVDALCMKHREWVGRAVPVISGINQSYMVIPLQYGSRIDHDFVANTDTTAGIPSTVTCSEDDFDTQAPGQLRNVRKRFTSIEVIAQGEDLTQPVTLQLEVDNVLRQVLTVQDANRRRIMRKLNVGDGYTLQVGLLTDGSVAQDLPLLGVVVYYRPCGTDMSRKT
jgi:hypothetical protein